MNFPVPRNKKEKREMMIAQSTVAMEGFEERFSEIKNLVDPADRLLMLERLGGEVRLFQLERSSFIDEKNPFLAILAGVGTIGGGAVAGGMLLGGPVGMMVGATVVAGIGSAREMYLEKKVNKPLANQIGLPASAALMSRIYTSRQGILEKTDILTLAESPHAMEAFTQFPQLKEKFLLAAEIDRVQERKKAERPLILDKPKPAQDDIRL